MWWIVADDYTADPEFYEPFIGKLGKLEVVGEKNRRALLI
jgi:hypothetical protein